MSNTYTFTGTNIEFDPEELQEVINDAINAKYGQELYVEVRDVNQGDYSDDILINVIASE
jgi:hypothetical protein